MIKFYFRTIKDNELSELTGFKNDALVYVSDPVDDDLDFLVEELNLDKRTILDALDINEIPRIEIKNKVIYIFLRAPVKEENNIYTLPFLLVISKNFFVIISKRLKILDNFIKKGKFYTTQKTKTFLKILFAVFNFYEIIITKLNKEIRAIGLDLKNVDEEFIRTFVRFEIILQELLTSLLPTHHIFSLILSKKILPLFENDKDLIEDLILKIEQLEDISKSSIKHIIHIREAYEAILTNNVNKAIKFLTALTVIIGFPTLVASLYGMNVSLPLANSEYAFFIITFINLLFMFLLFIYFHFKKWL